MADTIIIRVPADWPQRMRLMLIKLLDNQKIHPAEVYGHIDLLADAERTKQTAALTYDRAGRITLGDVEVAASQQPRTKSGARILEGG